MDNPFKIDNALEFLIHRLSSVLAANTVVQMV